MGPEEILVIAKTIRATMDVVEALESAGVRFHQLQEARRKARELGRDLTDEELLGFRESAQTAIDNARG